MDKALSLPWRFMAPDVVIVEMLLPFSWDLPGKGLIEMSLPGPWMQKVEELARRYPRPGRRDLISLALAMQQDALLLTGDEALRKAAEREGIEVHGTLWLLDAMVKEGVITELEGYRSLELMLKAGRRLPKREVARRMEGWRPGGYEGKERAERR